MNLETIVKMPDVRISDTPIVLIHGAWHGAWCWEDNFLDYFPSHGWETHAVSLRGHGKSDGASNLRNTSIRDYVEDIRQVVDGLDRPPILVGHSMGGFVIQKFLENHEVPGAVLLASAPHTGNKLITLRMARKYPFSMMASILTRNTYMLVRKPEMVAWIGYSGKVDPEVAAKHHEMIGQESFRASMQMGGPRGLPKPSKNKSPICVIGGELDTLISVREVQQTAKAYGVEPKIFPGMPHSLMAVPGWEAVAEWIDNWARKIVSAEALEPVPARG